MGDVTRAEFDRLHKEVRETRLLAEVILCRGLDRDEWTPKRVQEWIDDELDRRDFSRAFGKNGVARSGLYNDAWWALHEAGMPTLEEVADRSRSEIAAVRGIGRASMRCLDDALEKHGLTWRESEQREAVAG